MLIKPLPMLLQVFSLPLKNPVLIFSLILFIILLTPVLLQRLRIPDLIGLIIAGVVLLIRERKNFEFYTAPEELPRGVRTSTAILNVGVVTYIVVTVIITSINLMMQ